MAATACSACGTEPLEDARFCHGCGSPVDQAETSAEYKQVTVLFADVVHSMGIAAAVGAERLREIMTQLVEHATAAVRRYDGTVDKFTGDGIMAVFGAPVALEDHAFRACLAALDLQLEAKQLALDVKDRDGIDLQLRVGLNSGEVITGDVGSGAGAYTAIGEQVGMAQRMESAAPAGGVMLSESTARLVDEVAVLDEAEMVRIKGAEQPVSARRLLGIAEHRTIVGRQTTLVGREWELAALTGVLDRSITGSGAVVGVVAPPGVGKSRLVAELAATAASRGVAVYSSSCESHASEIPFHAVSRLLRGTFGVDEVSDEDARTQLRSRVPDADAEDLLLLQDLLGVRDSEVSSPDIAPEARRRRLTALVNGASLARSTPAVYVIEDVHWIDEVSESLLADFLAVIPRTPSLVLMTYRPEYHGPLSTTPGAQTIALAPLNDSETGALIIEMVGPDPSLASLTTQITDRAAGNPFFAQEIVRDLAGRGVLRGERGDYRCEGVAAEAAVPATLQAAIAARIDRLDAVAKRTLNAAAVIGSQFDAELPATLIGETALPQLIQAELVDQIKFTPKAEYVFRHPLIRTVAYESQLKSGRAALHRKLATEIEEREPDSADENAALIAEHLEAAGDLPAAYGWHMRAGAWATTRDIVAAHTSWRRARDVADRLPESFPDRLAMRIGPRTFLCASAFRVGGSGAPTGFDELRALCDAAGDKRSLAIGMTGLIAQHFTQHHAEASALASEQIRLFEAIDDPVLTVGFAIGAHSAKLQAGEIHELHRLADRVVTLADGDADMGNEVMGSPLASGLAFRGIARSALGLPGWRDDFEDAFTMARGADLTTLCGVLFFVYATAVPWILPVDATALRYTKEALEWAQKSGDDLALDLARCARGIVLVYGNGRHRETGLDFLAEARKDVERNRFSYAMLGFLDVLAATGKAAADDLDSAVELSRRAADQLFPSGESIWPIAARVLVESLIRRGGEGDVHAAQVALDRAEAAMPTAEIVGIDLHYMYARALIARARGDERRYREIADRYLTTATSLGYHGHIAAAKALT
jgi:adenylate cyclase